ncbi:MAG: hypothetical protein JWL90_1054, partial [Chthoniobacteraceae bacterium]|nr:hypothetical protein [Chthoniobacteraceae bacterium]
MLIRLLPFAVFLTAFPWEGAAGNIKLIAQPARIELKAEDNEHGLLITRMGANGERIDVTRQTHFSSSSPEIVTVDATGHCRALGDGEAKIVAELDGQQIEVKVLSAESGKPRIPSFKQDIIPILTKTGCNAGGCHGKLAGQNGFRLSLRGFAPEWDHDWVSKEVNSRRINVAFPAESLIVQKAAGMIAHEGGTRFKQGSRYYQTLLDWVGARAPGPVDEEADAIKLEVLPGDREMKPGQTQRLLVRALYADGRT